MRAPVALPSALRLPLAILSTVSAVAVVVMGAAYAGESAGTPLDVSLRTALTDLDEPRYRLGMILDYLGEPAGAALVLITLAVVAVRLGNRRAAVLAFVGTGLSVAVTSALKPLVGRTINDGFLSFPSGHTAAATSFALVAALMLVERRRLGATAGTLLTALIVVPVGAAMAWAQVATNVHYPTDTVGGFCTALAVLPPTAWLIDRIADRLPGKV